LLTLSTDALRHRITENKIYVVVICLAGLDVLTTFIASMSLGARFGELGMISGYLIHSFPKSWPLLGFLSESAVFGITTFVFARKVKDKLRLASWTCPFSYLPAVALAGLVLNNSIAIFLSQAGALGQ